MPLHRFLIGGQPVRGRGRLAGGAATAFETPSPPREARHQARVHHRVVPAWLIYAAAAVAVVAGVCDVAVACRITVLGVQQLPDPIPVGETHPPAITSGCYVTLEDTVVSGVIDTANPNAASMRHDFMNVLYSDLNPPIPNALPGDHGQDADPDAGDLSNDLFDDISGLLFHDLSNSLFLGPNELANNTLLFNEPAPLFSDSFGAIPQPASGVAVAIGAWGMLLGLRRRGEC